MLHAEGRVKDGRRSDRGTETAEFGRLGQTPSPGHIRHIALPDTQESKIFQGFPGFFQWMHGGHMEYTGLRTAGEKPQMGGILLNTNLHPTPCRDGIRKYIRGN